MTSRRRSLALGALFALASLCARADDSHKAPPGEDPDPGFLEFLGSVDRLADVNPDYLAQSDPGRLARGNGKPRLAPPPPPPPPPPPSAPGVKNNES